MITDGDAPTHEMVRPVAPTRRDRLHDIARDVREVALTIGSLVWIAAGAAFLIGIGRILTKVW